MDDSTAYNMYLELRELRSAVQDLVGIMGDLRDSLKGLTEVEVEVEEDEEDW